MLFMREVYKSPDSLIVYHFKNLLENEGIKSTILSFENSYELWVNNKSHYFDALEIIKVALSNEDPSSALWICPNCNEENENQFSECWNCGKEKP